MSADRCDCICEALARYERSYHHKPEGDALAFLQARHGPCRYLDPKGAWRHREHERRSVRWAERRARAMGRLP